MIRRVTATHIWGELEAITRTRPLRMECVDDKGRRIDAYVKLLSRSDQGSNLFVNETIGGNYGRLLNLATPEPIGVSIPEELLPALADRATAEDIRNSPGLQFGSVSLGDGWHTAGAAVLKARRPEALQQALVILLMDLIAENGDRTERNPNLLVSAKGFAPIDHDLAFSNFPFVAPPDIPFKPWDPQFFARAKRMIENHLFFRTLVGRRLDFGLAGGIFSAASPAKLRSLARQVPREWVHSTAPPERITDYLVDARKNMPALLELAKFTLKSA